MKEKVSNEYKRTARTILETKLSGENVLKEINSSSISLLQYCGPFLEWTKEEYARIGQENKKTSNDA